MENTNKINHLIFLYLEKKASAEDISQLSDFINESEENANYFTRFITIYKSTDKGNIKKINTKKVLDKITKKNRKTLKPFALLQKIAAVLFIPIATLLIYQNLNKAEEPEYIVDSLYEINTINGTRGQFVLPDSSVVWLNSNSSLAYPPRFTKDTREVYLKGEAYFEVKSNEEHPFKVITPTMTVNATGTEFNVSDYAMDADKEVTLASGKVSIDINGYESIGLKPNQHLKYNNEKNKCTLHEDNTFKYYAWKDGKLIFRNDPMAYVAKIVGRLYGADIKIKNKDLQNYTYYATFESESLKEILELLKLSAPIDYKEIERVQQQDGSFSDAQIIILKK